MTAISAPNPASPHQLSNTQENLRQYFTAQIQQLSPEPSPRPSMARIVIRQDSNQTSSKSTRRTNIDTPTNSEPENAVPYVDDRTNDWVRQTGALVRSNTDVGPGMSRLLETERPENAQEHWELRHGYDELYNSAGYLAQLSAVSNIILNALRA